MQVLCSLLSLSVLCGVGLVSVGHAANETDQDPVQMMRHRLGDMTMGFVVAGCAPQAGSGATLAAFACTANVKDGAYSIPVVQDAASVGPLTAGDGTYWLAVYKDRTSPVSGWTRQTNTHYLWHHSEPQPATPSGGLVIAVLSLTGSSVSAVHAIGNHVPTPPSTLGGGLGVSAAEYGIVCDGVTDTWGPFQNALNHIPEPGVLVLPPGKCLLSQPLDLRRTISLRGAGTEHTFLWSTTTNQAVLSLYAQNIQLSHLTLSRTGPAVAGGDGLVVSEPGAVNRVYLHNLRSAQNWRGFVIGGVAYAWGSNLVAEYNNSHGFEFTYTDVNQASTPQWEISYSLAQQNKGIGFGGRNVAAVSGVGPWISHSLTFANDEGGYVFFGTPGYPIHNLRLNEVISSFDNGPGVFLDTYGNSHTVMNAWIEYAGQSQDVPIGWPTTMSVKKNTGDCVTVSSNNGVNIVLVGGQYIACSWNALSLETAGTTLVGGASRQNGLGLSVNAYQRAGVYITANRVSVLGHAFETPGAGTLNYIYYTGTITQMAIGLNTYNPDLPIANYVNTAAATLTGTTAPFLPTGVYVPTNTPGTGFFLSDATGGPFPAKSVRVAGGALQVLNSDASAVIEALSDAGTPAWPKRAGTATLSGTNIVIGALLTPGEPDGNYHVQVTPVTRAGSPATGAFTIVQIDKFTDHFDIVVAGAPGAGNSVSYDWLLYRH
jgi:hypothetical protein